MEPSLDLLPFPSLWMTRAAGSPFGPITELEVRGKDCFCFHGSQKAQSGRGGLAGGSRSQAIGAPTLTPGCWLCWQKTEVRAMSWRATWEQSVSLPLWARVGLPTLPQEGVTQGPIRWVAGSPGGSAWGHTRAWVCWGSGRPLKERVEGGGGDIWRQKFSQAWWLPLLAIPRRRHEGMGLSPGVCIQAASHGPSARPGPHPTEPH